MSEDVHPRADELDSLTSLELVELMQEEDQRAVAGVKAELPRIAEAVERLAGALRAGGRLHYFGAGTSGRIAALEAAECPATFGVTADLVRAHVPPDGKAEDDHELGRSTAVQLGLGPNDAVVGVSASGSTRYAVGAFEEAARAGALRVAVTCRRGSALARLADVAVEVETGPEVIAGSTRLKAGTVQKVVVNMIGTAVFTRLGHTHRGRMVSVVASNAKLRTRAVRIVADLAAVSERDAKRALIESDGDVKVAIVMARRSVSAASAAELLRQAGGDLDSVVGGVHR
ncbi:MAG TPA: N-acetylmuramic acid 6-phosphate etherase [Candidatus Udaeobacter sp.]|nr:N-acetylmuramic acid 6-phosphate etherase [Candidatus Udaeobacter sp.]